MRPTIQMTLMACLLGLALGCGADAGSGATGAASDAATQDAMTLADGGGGDAGAVGDALAADAALPDASQPDIASDTGSVLADADDAGTTTGPDGSADVAAPGLCGNKVGDILCNADLRGYLSLGTSGKASDTPYLESFSVAELMAKATPQFAVILLGAWW